MARGVHAGSPGLSTCKEWAGLAPSIYIVPLQWISRVSLSINTTSIEYPSASLKMTAPSIRNAPPRAAFPSSASGGVFFARRFISTAKAELELSRGGTIVGQLSWTSAWRASAVQVLGKYHDDKCFGREFFFGSGFLIYIITGTTNVAVESQYLRSSWVWISAHLSQSPPAPTRESNMDMRGSTNPLLTTANSC